MSKVKDKVAPGRPVRAVTLKNVMEPNLTVVDTLHKSAIELNTHQTSCTHNRCVGSLMVDIAGYPNKKPRTKEITLEQAKDFIHQFYASTDRINTPAHDRRWKAVKSSINKTGSYDLTYDELVFGTKTAWRNASRCIGRIQWSKLEVLDCRKVETAREMFDSILTHLKYATNGGNIRSAITIFPQRKYGTLGNDFKVWNSLVIGYAGYRQLDGSIIGDPNGVEIAEVAIKLGWKPRRTRFDVLPLILQANGGDPEFFEIPPEYILEVDLKHPSYPKFEELGLKWIAVPGVSNMLFDCGGLEFTGVPFNGWFMSTEVASRDLCDSGRYNILKKAAEAFDIPTISNQTLWKDRVCLEVNVAVLESYNKSGVTIVDHHSASESFIKHMANEQKIRGGCPADWVWVVPPMSGSLTQVFHQEMMNYKLKPSYEYQDSGWLVHKWREEKNIKVFGVKRVRSFKITALAAMFMTVLIRDILSKRKKCTILYATETGRSQMYATKVEEVFKYGFNVKLFCMEDYDIYNLNKEDLLLVVAATTGNGDAPANGKVFQKKMKQIIQANGEIEIQETNLKKKNSNPLSLICCRKGHQKGKENFLPLPLTNITYSVFGLGSRAYPNFCQFAHDINGGLTKMGCECILPTGEGCEIEGQDDPFNDWAKEVFETACARYGVTEDQMKQGTALLDTIDKTWKPGKFQLVNTFDTEPDIIKGLSDLHKAKVKHCKFRYRKNLKSDTSKSQTILAAMAHDESDHFAHSPGDHIAIFPANDSALVENIMNNLVDCPPLEDTFTIDILQDKLNGQHEWTHFKRLPVTTMVQALARYLDITTPPSQKLLSQLIQLAEDTGDQEQLKMLVKNPEEYLKWKKQYWPNIAEIFDLFPSLKVPATFLLTQLPKLQQRFYSISSSPQKVADQIDITVALVQYHMQDSAVLHKGVCTNYLNGLNEGDLVPCYIRACKEFHMPEEPEIPIIMVATGSGIAPFRSFWQERAAAKEYHNRSRRKLSRRLSQALTRRSIQAVQFGPINFYFGCRTVDDDLHREETQAALKENIISSITTAYSRDPQSSKTYVQKHIHDNKAEVFDIIDQRNGHFYVCGAVTMAQDVKETLIQIIKQEGKMTEEKAKEYFETLQAEQRYHEDIFGVGTGSGE